MKHASSCMWNNNEFIFLQNLVMRKYLQGTDVTSSNHTISEKKNVAANVSRDKVCIIQQ